MQQYETSDALFITDYEEDSDLETAPCGSVSAEHFTMWTEEELADSESAMGKRENHAVRLKWKDTKAAYYEIALDEPMAMGEGGICFDAMDLREKAENEPMDFSVVLTDIHGNRAVSTLCDSTILYPAFPVKLSKLQYITGKMNIRGSFRPCISRKSSLRRKTDLTGVRSEVYGLRLTG